MEKLRLFRLRGLPSLGVSFIGGSTVLNTCSTNRLIVLFEGVPVSTLSRLLWPLKLSGGGREMAVIAAAKRRTAIQ